MQKFKFSITLLAIILGALLNTQAQFNRQQAIDTVLNQVVAADTGNIRVYIANNTFTTGDALVTYTLDTISSPFSTYYVFLSMTTHLPTGSTHAAILWWIAQVGTIV
jgi:hypothetical protein